jgi:DNA-binding response OmpR family regulator
MPQLLLIEDSQHIQRVYREKFAHEGFEVTTGNDGEQGLALARQHTPDIILLDIMLPRLSGFDVLKQLRDDPQLNRIPVFMLSNKSWPDDVQHALSLGARQFHSKGSSSLQDIITQIRIECALKKITIISSSPDSVNAIRVALRHPQLLCSTVTVLAETVAAVQRGLPDLVVLDLRPPAHNNVLPLLQQLRATPGTHAVPILAITDQSQPLARVEVTVSAEHFDTDLRSTVLQFVRLAEPASTVLAAAR